MNYLNIVVAHIYVNLEEKKSVRSFINTSYKLFFKGSFKITNVMAQPTGESTKVKVKVRINSHGCFNILSANMYEKLEGQVNEEEEETKESMEVDDESKKKDTSPTDAVNGEQVKFFLIESSSYFLPAIAHRAVL